MFGFKANTGALMVSRKLVVVKQIGTKQPCLVISQTPIADTSIYCGPVATIMTTDGPLKKTVCSKSSDSWRALTVETATSGLSLSPLETEMLTRKVRSSRGISHTLQCGSFQLGSSGYLWGVTYSQRQL